MFGDAQSTDRLNEGDLWSDCEAIPVGLFVFLKLLVLGFKTGYSFFISGILYIFKVAKDEFTIV